MLKIEVKDNRATLIGVYPKDKIDQAISAYQTGFQYSSLYRRRRSNGERVWDGKIHLLSRASDSFPSGVLDIVCEVLDAEGISYEITYHAIARDIPDHIATDDIQYPVQVGKYVLRDYQLEAMKAFLNSKSRLPYKGIICAGTGSGKTVVAIALAKLIDVNTLFLVKGKALKAQSFNVFTEALGEDNVGVIDAKTWEPKQITVASVDTLASRLANAASCDKTLNYLKSVQFVVADEVHRGTSQRYKDVLNYTPANIRLGLSGTPNKGYLDKDLVLNGLCGGIVHKINSNQLQAQGNISKAELKAIIIDKPKLESLSWREAQSSLVINNTERHEIVATLVRQEYNKGRIVLVMAGNSIPLTEQLHSFILKEVKDEDQVRMVTGQSSAEYTNESFQLMRDKKLKVIITTVIADEGIDIPEINSLFIVNGGKCLSPEQGVLLHSGRSKKAKDILVGDMLLGPDNKQRTVLETTSGVGPMYKIVPKKGDSWGCNGKHILTLIETSQKKIVDISVEEYLKQNDCFKNRYLLFVPDQIEFPKSEEPSVDPYFLGLWFGDGTKNLHKYSRVSITTMDEPIKEYCKMIANNYGLDLTELKSNKGKAKEYSLSSKSNTNRFGTRKNKTNKLLTNLLSLVGEKSSVPNCIKYGSIETRKQFLAGFIDTDGWLHSSNFFEVSQKRKDYIDDIRFISGSLGFKSSCKEKITKGIVYYRCSIYGNLEKIPTKLKRKQAKIVSYKKHGKRCKFKVVPTGIGNYFGFSLDGDGRFLLDDFTVTHNSFVKTIQRIGRGLRVKSDGSVLTVFDFMDSTNPYLKKHSNKRLEHYNSEGIFSTADFIVGEEILKNEGNHE